MKRRALLSLGVFGIALVANWAYAVVPPGTSLETTWNSMSLMDWLTYGSLVIVLGGLFIATAMLLARFARTLFRR